MSMPKNRAKKSAKHQQQKLEIVELSQYKKKINVVPKNLSQENYVAALSDESKNIVVAVGPAGTGKTLFAVQYALKAYWAGKIDKIVITRPSLPSEGEDIGFLPGSAIEKMTPWARPILDEIGQFYSKKELERLINEEIIELSPIAFIRGRTFKNAYVIIDESQNLSVQAFKAAITRIGENSRIIVTGDLAQGDRGVNNGLQDFLNRFKGSKHIEIVHFEKKDVLRHPVIEEILHLYGE